MMIQFLGTGGAFDVPYKNSSAIVRINGRTILLDCGHSVFPTLFEKDLLNDIDDVLITHLHDDHVGSLSSFLLYRNIMVPDKPLRLLYPIESFRQELYTFLAFSMGKPENRIEMIPIDPKSGIGFIDTRDRHVIGMQTFSYYFQEGEESIVYSGDLGDVDFLFNEIERLQLPSPVVFHEIFFWPGYPGHAYYKLLIPYLENYRIYGYHCDRQNNPEDNPVPLVVDHPEWLL